MHTVHETGLCASQLSASEADLLLDGLSPAVDKLTLLESVSQDGQIQDLMLLPFGHFNRARVSFASKRQAAKAAAGLSGFSTGLLSQDDGVPSADMASDISRCTHSPSNIVHIQFVPEGWDEQRLTEVFSNFGSVVACCIQPSSLEDGTTEALVRMSTIAAASEGIQALDSSIFQEPHSNSVIFPMKLKFFDSASHNRLTAFDNYSAASTSEIVPSMHSSLTLDSSSGMRSPVPSLSSSNPDYQAGDQQPFRLPRPFGLAGQLHSGVSTIASVVSQDAAADVQRSSCKDMEDMLLPTGIAHSSKGSAPVPDLAGKSIYVSNLPPEADSLWVYERFAPYGGVLSVKVLHEQKSGKCRGVCFVNYMDCLGAASAIQSLDGIRIAGRFLQVKLQNKRR